MSKRRWVKPAIRPIEFTAQLGCACACGALAGSGSGQSEGPITAGPIFD